MRSKWVLPLFACLGLSLTISGQGVQAVQVKSITLPVVFGSMSPVGNWSGSAIIQVENPRSAAPIIRAFDRNGQKIGEFTLAIPGANLIRCIAGNLSEALTDHSRLPDTSIRQTRGARRLWPGFQRAARTRRSFVYLRIWCIALQ
jgi:hypothetical protein